MRIKILNKDAAVLRYATEGAVGLDLTAVSINREVNYVEYGTGIAVEIPPGFVGILVPRSSVSNTGLMLANSVGIIDQDYRGEVKFRFKQVTLGNGYSVGDRIGQLVLVPCHKPQIDIVEELEATARGSGGFGSTGR